MSASGALYCTGDVAPSGQKCPGWQGTHSKTSVESFFLEKVPEGSYHTLTWKRQKPAPEDKFGRLAARMPPAAALLRAGRTPLFGTSVGLCRIPQQFQLWLQAAVSGPASVLYEKFAQQLFSVARLPQAPAHV